VRALLSAERYRLLGMVTAPSSARLASVFTRRALTLSVVLADVDSDERAGNVSDGELEDPGAVRLDVMHMDFNRTPGRTAHRLRSSVTRHPAQRDARSQALP
jgi:hypothetical protein